MVNSEFEWNSFPFFFFFYKSSLPAVLATGYLSHVAMARPRRGERRAVAEPAAAPVAPRDAVIVWAAVAAARELRAPRLFTGAATRW